MAPDPTPPVFTLADVATLRYGELAVALYAADIPTPGTTSLSAPEAERLVVQGVTRLGLARVRAIDRDSRRLAAAIMAGWEQGLDTTGWESERLRLWPSPRREDAALGLAWSIVLARSGPSRPVSPAGTDPGGDA